MNDLQPPPADPVHIRPPDQRLDQLIALAGQLVERQEEDPFGNPVLAIALQLSRRLDEGSLSIEDITNLVCRLRDDAFEERAARLARYVGLGEEQDMANRLRQIAARLIRPDPNDSPIPLAQFRAAIHRTRFSAVFTAHPTFALATPVYAALAETASGTRTLPEVASQRPTTPTLTDEFDLAVEAILRGRNAIDKLNAALLEEAAGYWPQAWTSLVPRPLTLASWVGYDTDGRTDIGWWDTLRLRLRMKLLQLQRLHDQLGQADQPPAPILDRVAAAMVAVEAQIEAAPDRADPEQVAAFSRVLIDRRDEAILSPSELDDAFGAAIGSASEPDRLTLAVARAGFVSHGMGAAHTHVRLNATQIHNVARQRLGIEDSPENPAQRRALLTQINDVLSEVQRIPVDFGALLTEQASAARLMMTVTQIIKHIDSSSPIRFLIAETESGYTLLVALWLARLFGIEDKIEISPLFETRDALMQGSRIIEEALHSRHYRDYLRRTGKLSLQFGYSDSGRYVGQLAATYLVERLRLKIADLLAKRGMTDVEIILFDTHGESIGRGAHPFALADRLDYLSPSHSRQAFGEAGIAYREEAAFQGGDGYLLFGTQKLADAVISTIATHAFAVVKPERDPIYDEPDFSADFFAAIGLGMTELVEDPGYAGLLGAFGPALIDRTGSRPAARQSDSAGGPARIRHPRELRAIPNNAILQQLGWCANTLQGLGLAAARHPETFEEFLLKSPRFRRALDFASHALAHSDRDVLRAIVLTLDPGVWLDRAAHENDPARRNALVTLSEGLERLDLWAITQSMFRRIQADHLALRAAWPDAPRMRLPEVLLHAIRLTLIERIWLLSTRIPYFSPRNGFTREALDDQVLRLEIPNVLKQLAEIFPQASDQSVLLDFREQPGPRSENAYTRENAEIFQPMRRLFELVREVSVGVMHNVGAFG
ncbi:phosphoenolpyruvate carboxylase [Lichenicola cladoniae]|uniref:Phosphoenolpyruvate carboxylase n=1 Tax=Lichenicola cladoniae TaxID=1484109 RepID=A0A6M8HQB3_9PROT|nr:phosphoenolpyruvate carboxylase [Lichenicola cladoniae]NPD67948.1 phosphoenolpyruvate carboxylase [Acetobacteraceae bacterium]QKE90538.1 phosphoenolpyruvate carboxylase [Lichenicola cladoniae]